MRVLLIDDCKNLGNPDIIARNYNSGIEALTKLGPWDCLLLDHDLDSFDENGYEFTGTNIMNFLIENIEYAPKEIRCVSQNPIGYKKINLLINDLKKIRGF
jgi:hypothetical protein